MTTLTKHSLVPYEHPNWVAVLPSRWVAEYDGEAAGTIDVTTTGRYRATDRRGHVVGTYRSLERAREKLIESNMATPLERLDRSKTLMVLGLLFGIAASTLAAFGLMSLIG
ncbi:MULTISPECIES: hypothetical protein [unclassified Cryobacterium]|uniref:hypothetical protein n=1 Tax=unclassified Cryobacterium TaxID=2649013 RepID=UPI001444E4B3|nr:MULTISPECIES: hypothetical protein [unclassified Cryobacterium]